jgi:hypothetical protein
MAGGNATCPMSRAPLSPVTVPNLAVRSIISRCVRELAPLPAPPPQEPPLPRVAYLITTVPRRAPGPLPRVAHLPTPASARAAAAAAATAPRRAPGPLPRVALLAAQREAARRAREERARVAQGEAARDAARARQTRSTVDLLQPLFPLLQPLSQPCTGALRPFPTRQPCAGALCRRHSS